MYHVVIVCLFFIAGFRVFRSSTSDFLSLSLNCLVVSLITSSFFVIGNNDSANFTW